jgi:alanyl-tRNA synthetase
MGVDYPDLLSSRGFIEGMALNEEKRFAATLYHGMRILQDHIEELKGKKETTIPGAVAFKLYDTYGLSPDIVQDVAREEGLKVDLEGFDRAMARQRSLSQESWKGSGEEEIPDVYRALANRGVTCEFIGYEALVGTAKVTALLMEGEEVSSAKAGDRVEVVLDRTPFYGEAGGQVGDTGWLTGNGMRMKVTNTLKFGDNLFVHKGIVEQGTLTVGPGGGAGRRRGTTGHGPQSHGDPSPSRSLERNPGAPCEAGRIFVSPRRFRFDFSHFSQVDQETLKEVERLVNRTSAETSPSPPACSRARRL